MKINQCFLLLFLLIQSCTYQQPSDNQTTGKDNKETLTVRNAHAMVYHSKEAKVYLFGGADHEKVLSDLWRFDNLNWEKVYTENAPFPRTFAGMSYDNKKDRIILFGGSKVLFGKELNEKNLLQDTWEFKNNKWKKIETETMPSPRAEAAMVYDEFNDRMVLFGGYTIQENEIIKLGDTWYFQDNKWQLISKTGPSKRHGVAMAYDSDNHQVMLFGGSTVDKQYGKNKGETWLWQDEVWVKQATNPMRGLFNATMAYDQLRHKFILFGGWNGQGRSDNAYSYSNGEWKEIKPITSPAPRNHSQMVYDEANNRMLLFGGHNGEEIFGDTWEYINNNWRKLKEIQAVKRINNGH